MTVVAWCCLGLVFLALCAAVLLAPFEHGDSQFTVLGSSRELFAGDAVGGALRVRVLPLVVLFATASACFVAVGAVRRPDLRASKRGVAVAGVLSVSLLAAPLALGTYVTNRRVVLRRVDQASRPPPSGPRLAAPTTVPTDAPETTTTTLSWAEVAGVARCQTRGLSVERGEQAGMLGHGWEVIVLRNTSREPCFMFGYPSLRSLDGSKKALPIQVRQGGSDYTFPDVRPSPVRVEPGATASFAIGSVATSGSDPPEDVCVEPAFLSVRPPGQSPVLVEGPGFYCHGWIVVSAIVAGDRGVRY